MLIIIWHKRIKLGNGKTYTCHIWLTRKARTHLKIH